MIDPAAPQAPSAESGKSPIEGVRKPYQAPRILSREPLEAMASACAAPTGKPIVGICSAARS